MDRKAFGERVKLYVGITGTPAASAEAVMREARTRPFYRSYRSKDDVDRLARRSKWWWLRLRNPCGVANRIAATIALLGGLLVTSGFMEGFLHYRLFAKNRDSLH